MHLNATMSFELIRPNYNDKQYINIYIYINNINNISCDLCLTEREGVGGRDKEAEREREVQTQMEWESNSRNPPGMHTRDYKQHGAPGSRAGLHNAVRKHNNMLGGGIVAVSATVVELEETFMVAWSVDGRGRDNEIVSAPKMLTLQWRRTTSRGVFVVYIPINKRQDIFLNNFDTFI